MSVLIIFLATFLGVAVYWTYAAVMARIEAREAEAFPQIATMFQTKSIVAMAWALLGGWMGVATVGPMLFPTLGASATWIWAVVVGFMALTITPAILHWRVHLQMRRGKLEVSAQALLMPITVVVTLVAVTGTLLFAAYGGVAPHTFNGQHLKVYEPVESPICVGEPVNFDLEFEVNPPSGELITIDWDTTWHKEVDEGERPFLIASSGTQSWVYYQPAVFSFGITPQQPPSGVDAGTWTLAGHALVNNSKAGAGYIVTVEYVDCSAEQQRPLD